MRNALLTTASAAVIALSATAANAQDNTKTIDLENCYGVTADELQTLEGIEDGGTVSAANQQDGNAQDGQSGSRDRQVTADSSAATSGSRTGRTILVLPGAADSQERGDPGIQQGEMIPRKVPAKRLDAQGQTIASDPNQTMEARESGPSEGSVQTLDGSRQAASGDTQGTTGVAPRKGDMAFATDEKEEGGLTDQQVAENYKEWRDKLDASRTDGNQTASVSGNGRPGDAATQTSQQEEARRALTVARAVLPEVEFSHWRRAQHADANYVFTGEHETTGRRIAVHVNRDGRISEIEEQIPLRAMPRPLREFVGASVNGLRVADTQRSIREDFDVYYELEGVLRSGRPVQLEIRADGRDFTLFSPVNG